MGGLTAGGQAMNAMSQNAHINEVNRQNRIAADISRKAREAEIARQGAFEREATQRWDESVQNLAPAQRAAVQDAAEQRIMTAYEQSPPLLQEGMYLSGQDTAAAPIKEEIAARTAKFAQDARQRAQALAKLSAFGTADTTNQINLQGTNSQLATIGGLRRGSLGVAQTESNIPAAVVHKTPNLLGDIMTGVGMLGGRMVGGGGLGSMFGGGTPTPTISPFSLY